MKMKTFAQLTDSERQLAIAFAQRAGHPHCAGLQFRFSRGKCVAVQSGLSPVIERSDKRIQSAVATLQASERGQQTLRDLKKMCDNGADGLDLSGMSALVVLIREVAYGRREFLHAI